MLVARNAQTSSFYKNRGNSYNVIKQLPRFENSIKQIVILKMSSNELCHLENVTFVSDDPQV
jgi:hypothetical protein